MADLGEFWEGQGGWWGQEAMGRGGVLMGRWGRRVGGGACLVIVLAVLGGVVMLGVGRDGQGGGEGWLGHRGIIACQRCPWGECLGGIETRRDQGSRDWRPARVAQVDLQGSLVFITKLLICTIHLNRECQLRYKGDR